MTTSTDPPAQFGPAGRDAASLRRRVVRGGLVLIVTRFLTQAFVWASTLLIARYLDPRDYGLMSIGLLLVGLADLFAEAGIGGALIQKQGLDARDLNEAFTLNLLLAAVLYACLFGLANPLAVVAFDAPEL